MALLVPRSLLIRSATIAEAMITSDKLPTIPMAFHTLFILIVLCLLVVNFLVFFIYKALTTFIGEALISSNLMQNPVKLKPTLY